jgi:hypothetical protein
MLIHDIGMINIHLNKYLIFKNDQLITKHSLYMLKNEHFKRCVYVVDGYIKFVKSKKTKELLDYMTIGMFIYKKVTFLFLYIKEKIKFIF